MRSRSKIDHGNEAISRESEKLRTPRLQVSFPTCIAQKGKQMPAVPGTARERTEKVNKLKNFASTYEKSLTEDEKLFQERPGTDQKGKQTRD